LLAVDLMWEWPIETNGLALDCGVFADTQTTWGKSFFGLACSYPHATHSRWPY